MKKYEALQDFHGAISLRKGEIKTLDPKYFIVQDLLKARLICEVKEKKAIKKSTKVENEVDEMAKVEDEKGNE